MPKKNLPALPSAQKKRKKYTPVTYTEEETDLHTQKDRELKKMKADQRELTGITQQLNQYRSDPLILLTQRETVSALEQRATDITKRYGSQSALDRQVAELTQQVNDPKLKYLNSPDYRSQYQRLLDLGAGGQPVQNNFKEMGLEDLTPEERGAYNYHYYKHGKDKADAYLSTIQRDVNQRRANEILEGTNVEDNWVADFGSKMPLAYKAGLDSAQKGGQQFLSALAGDDTYSVPSAIQMASAQAREQMAEKGTIPLMLYDVAQNVGYEMPAIWANTVFGVAGKALLADDAIRAGKALMKAGEYLGNGLMTMPSVGSAYQNALDKGYTKEQAQTKAATVGLVEVAKNALYNKFGKMGGSAAEKAVQALDGKINNAATRVIAKFGAKAFLGFTGEYAQTILDKAADNMLLGTDHDIELFSEEAFYESMVETISGLITEGGLGVFEKANGVPEIQTVARFPAREIQYSDRITGIDATNVSSNTRGEKEFSMASLSKKPNIQGKVIGINKSVKLLADGSIDKKWIVQNVFAQCDVVQTNAPTPTYYVNIPDIGKRVEITTKGIVHGFIKSDTKNGKKVTPNALVNARVSLDLPNILNNSIEVNQSDRGDNGEVSYSHVLLGVAGLENTDGSVDYYVVRSVVEARKNQGAILTEANVLGKLHALNAKKIGQPQAQVRTDGSVALTSSTLFEYNVADLIYDVKNTFPDTFSQNVYDAMGMDRRDTPFSKYLLYSDRANTKLKEAFFGQVKSENTDKGGIYFESANGTVDFSQYRKPLNAQQQAGVNAAKVMKKLGIGGDIFFYESSVGADGMRVYPNGTDDTAPNGWYSKADGSIHIDLNAGKDGNGMVLYTLSHELTHFVEQWSADKYNAMADFLTENYGGEESVEARVSRKQQELSRQRGEDVSYEEAHAEVVAASMEAMLSDGNVVEKLSQLRVKDKTTLQRMKLYIDSVVNKIRAAYSGIQPDSEEGRIVQQMKDSTEKLQNIFAEALSEASDNFQVAEKDTVTEAGVKYSGNRAEGFEEYDVISTVYTIRNETAPRGQDLKKIGTMPSLYRKLFGLSGDVFVSHEHLYQNMVSRETAEAEGRFKLENSSDYHELSEETMIDAINQFQNPIAIMESLKDLKEPRLVAVLDQKGNDGQNLIAVMELYTQQRANEVKRMRNHVMITIYEKSDLPNYLKNTEEKGRMLYIREGVSPDKLAGLQLAGKISKETLDKNLAQFNKKVKQFKQDHNINYSMRAYDFSELSERQNVAVQQQYTRWIQETEAAKGMYGDFDLREELQNPRFRHLLRSGISVPDAYLAAHQEEILINAVRAGLRRGEENVNRRVEENRRRPRENGLDPGAAFITRPNPAKMTKADRQAIARRAQKGEKIVF